MNHCLIDARGKTFAPQNYGRIVSLVPSQTEFLLEIGAPVVGRTRFCIHPREQMGAIPIVGGTKDFNLAKIRALQPDLVIANLEENTAELAQIETEIPVYTTQVRKLGDALQMMRDLGRLLQRNDAAQVICQHITAQFEAFTPLGSPLSCLYLIWRDPWMAVGGDSFIAHMLAQGGLNNVVTQARYPELSAERMAELNPDVVFLSSEPYPFKDQHISEVQSLCPSAQVHRVDGELFSWYGSRLAHLPAYFEQLLTLLEPRA